MHVPDEQPRPRDRTHSRRATLRRRPLAPSGRPGDADVEELFLAARDGDGDAWGGLVRAYEPRLRHIARSCRLAPDDVDDIVQATWVELFKAIRRIRDPAAVGGWLATVTRRNALRSRQLQMREQLTDDADLGESAEGTRSRDFQSPEASVLASERHAALAAAVAGLPDRHRRLLTVLVSEPDLGYRQVSERLGMPVGSIGPIRARALARLARDESLLAVSDRVDVPKRPQSPDEPSTWQKFLGGPVSAREPRSLNSY
jgi:RNA polymerase sigma factor (sigma-70 family)